MATRLSADGRRLIQGFEGLSLKAYPDTSKGYSIGYGHFGAKAGDVISQAEAERLFDQDVAKYETAVALGATREATQQQFDAMTSLAYNIGTAGFKGSTVLRLHNAGDTQGAADAFRMWKKSDGKDNPVLVKRREKERGVYLNGYGYGGVPPMTPAPAAPAASSPPQASGGVYEPSSSAGVSSSSIGLGAGILAAVVLLALALAKR